MGKTETKPTPFPICVSVRQPSFHTVCAESQFHKVLSRIKMFLFILPVWLLEGNSHSGPNCFIESNKHRRREVLCNYIKARMWELQSLVWLVTQISPRAASSGRSDNAGDCSRAAMQGAKHPYGLVLSGRGNAGKEHSFVVSGHQRQQSVHNSHNCPKCERFTLHIR